MMLQEGDRICRSQRHTVAKHSHRFSILPVIIFLSTLVLILPLAECVKTQAQIGSYRRRVYRNIIDGRPLQLRSRAKLVSSSVSTSLPSYKAAQNVAADVPRHYRSSNNNHNYGPAPRSNNNRAGRTAPRKKVPTIPYTPGVERWSIQRPKPRPRYYRHTTITPLSGYLNTMTSKIFASNVLVFAAQTLYPKITEMGAKVSQLILEEDQFYRLLTPVFLHGGIGHLAMNCYSLLNIGPNVESLFGTARFTATYLVSGVTGNILSAVMTPNPSVGASGAIFGLIGAYYVFLQRNKVFFGASGERSFASVQRTMLINVAFGFTSSNIDNWAHLGGAIGGAAMAYYFGPKLYLMDDETGIPGRQFMVDMPVLSVSLSSLDNVVPNKKNKEESKMKWQRLQRRMLTDNHAAGLPNRPWRNT